MGNSNTSMGRFDVYSIAKTLPQTATTLLVDKYLTDREAGSARVFRVYRPTPPHYHATCDEYLYALSGRGTFWMKDPSTKAEFGPANFSSSSAVRSTPCPKSSKSRSCSCRSIHHDVNQQTSYL
jgi:hypothetical protein